MKIRSLGNILEKYVKCIILVEIFFWNVIFWVFLILNCLIDYLFYK